VVKADFYSVFKVQRFERLDQLDLMLEPGLSACWAAGWASLASGPPRGLGVSFLVSGASLLPPDPTTVGEVIEAIPNPTQNLIMSGIVETNSLALMMPRGPLIGSPRVHRRRPIDPVCLLYVFECSLP